MSCRFDVQRGTDRVNQSDTKVQSPRRYITIWSSRNFTNCLRYERKLLQRTRVKGLGVGFGPRDANIADPMICWATMAPHFSSAHGLTRPSFLMKSARSWGSGVGSLVNSCPGRILRGRVACSGAAEEQPDKSRGGLPRFHVGRLPAFEGMVARVEGDEFSHMSKVLRLRVKDRVELFDGRGGIVTGELSSVSRTAAEVVTLEHSCTLAPMGPHWHVAAAFCTLKGGRGEWLVEKCTELGARTLTPLLTQRSSSVPGGRADRWHRIAMAASKQCQRLHSLHIEEPVSLQSFLPQISRAEVAFVAAAGAPPLYEMMSRAPSPLRSAMLFVGPEGDFTPDELDSLVSYGATAVGLGPRRLRVETATVAMLAAAMLMAETEVGNSAGVRLDSYQPCSSGA